MTKIYYLQGKTLYSELRKPDKEYDIYHVTLELDDKSMEKVKEAGLGFEFKTPKVAKFRRPHQSLMKGQIVEFGPPELMNKDLSEFEGPFIPKDSNVTIKISVYDTRKGTGHRLEAVRVDALPKGFEFKERAIDSDIDIQF